MTGPQLTGLQQVSLRILNDGVYDPEKLRINCPLDHGAHNINPEYDLGQLSRLPTELQDMVLDELDVNSLFTFRRVNQSAMNTVNKLAEYQKVFRSNYRKLLNETSSNRISRSWSTHQTLSAWP
jgi:hypothetical protein